MLTLYAVANWTADFGELVALAPAALAVGVFLVLDQRRSLALAWFQWLAVSLGLAALLKETHGPVSGHAAVAVALLGGFAILLWRDAFGLGAALRFLAVPIMLLAAGVCVSVFYLRWHSAIDVAGGLAVGALVPARLAQARLEPGQRRWNGAVALVLVAGLAAALHGVRLDDKVAHHLRLTVERIALVWLQRAA